MVLGIDISNASLACTLFDEQTCQVQAEGVVPKTEAGITRLLRRIPAAHSLVAEPTGSYSQGLVAHGQQAGRTVLSA